MVNSPKTNGYLQVWNEQMNSKGDQLSERILDFVVRVTKIVDGLPNTLGGRHIGGQLVSAATSCGANYEEGCAAESTSDFIHKMSVVLKELKETRFWLKLIHRTAMLLSEEIISVLNECEQLCAIIGKSIFTAKRRKNQSKV